MWCLQVPAKRVWRGLRARLGHRRATGDGKSCRQGWINQRRAGAGLRRLRKEVRTCEYSDVHVMWEMLSNTTTGSGVRDGRRRDTDTTAGKGAAATRPDRARAGRKAAAVAWSRLASYCCAI